ncbi:MAG: glycosyltransferase family 2 protein [bacterium]
MNNIELSVIVPVYNVEDYIEKCINSLQKQTFKNFEVLIIDDESQDKSIEIVKSLTKNDKRFKVISQKNKGLGGARNTGIKNASGKYLFFLDSDDYIKEETFQVLVNYIDCNSVDIAVYDYFRVDEHGKKLASPKFGKCIFVKEEAFSKILSLKTSPMACNKLYKKSLFLDNNIRYPEKFLHEDIATTYKLFWKSDRIGYVGEGFYYWVIRGSSITQKITHKHINDVVKTLLAKKEFLNENYIYEKFEFEYIRGCIQMLNILLERSWNYSFSINNFDLYRYAYNIVSNELIVKKNDIEQLGNFDKNLYKKFDKNFNKIQILKGKNQISKLRYIFLEKYIPIVKKVFIKYNYILKFFFPIGSRRREMVKSILRRNG